MSKSLLDVLCSSDVKSVFQRVRQEGLEDELAAFSGSPDAARVVAAEAVARFFVPVLPAVIRQLCLKAEKGDKDSTKMLLSLLGPKSPLREEIEGDLTALSQDGLERTTRLVMDQLRNAVNPKESKQG